MFRWNYYNRDAAQSRAALGLIDTRFHDHFNGLNNELEQTNDRQERLKIFGRLLSYLQDVTSLPGWCRCLPAVGGASRFLIVLIAST